MIGKKSERAVVDERLDRVGRGLIRASAMNEREAEAVATSPFLYTRLRSRIASEAKRREEGENWLAMLGVVWRAVPAMVLVALFAVSLFLTTNLGTNVTGGFNDEALFGTSDAEIERVVFADRQPLSSDEVLATILDGEEREVSR